MQRGPLPYILEDRTGANTGSDFDDIYDRLFFRVARSPSQTATMIYNMHRRASRHRDSLPFTQDPIVVLDFLHDESLGTVSFIRPAGRISQAMSKYLRKTSLFASSLSRKFTGSDGREYRWSYRSVDGQEWTCTTGAENYLVAHYDLKKPDVRVYGVSGHTLTIYEAFVHMAVELMTSLTIMRHIAQHNL
ncbi:uncharacterized protein EV420DRAFT_1272137 [Desarmillaria tabescens]|uniref:DUF6593 domain-containing protein n=1 Tax=Armillaria tabescens TaxID=1929756 RepID=A0AA39K7B1_ARMTA|nr:uncharacterized protein EV420DRAFT_1272137 [Desarmillaria tabescens]KAK0455633.1 hypothetical protein EV420DRAFT_1272137 [Desarmillaria tabescens]